MEEQIYQLIDLLNEMTPYLLLGFLIAGILHEFAPRKMCTGKLSGNNLRSVLWAAMIGIPLPLCSCGVIPTAASLRREGASRGATVSFLISTPQTGVDSFLATSSLLGTPFAAMRPLAAMATAIAGGCIVNRLRCDEELHSVNMEQDNTNRGIWQKCAGVLHYGFIEMMQDIGKWIVAGLLIAGIITIAVPDNFFIGMNEYPLLNMLAILAISIPMYLCATGSIPIAAALMLKGLSPGAAFVLLMAGPATNMAAILVIDKILGHRTLFVYLLTIIAGAIGFGLVIDHILPADWFTGNIMINGQTCCLHSTAQWWQVASSIIFVILLVTALFMRIKKHGCSHDDKESCCCNGDCGCTDKYKFHIKGMMCNHCKSNVEKALSSISGVITVRVELAEGIAYVEGRNIDTGEIVNTIKSLGYEYSSE